MSSGENGRLAGRYRVVRRLGRGGMGVVWHAVDEVLGREVAVKELRTYTDTAAGELADLRLRMTREARAAARVRHPGVVAVHDVTEHEGRPVIVMELVDGPSLDDVLKESGVLEPYEAARIGAGVLEALAAAHDAGVLHRDVKPGNILLDRSGRTVLTDFGIAAMEDPDDGSATRLTRSGEIIGSLDFLAPERARGQDPAPAADVWALGATLYAAVEGSSPFRRTSTWSTLAAIVADPLPEPRRSGPLAPVLLRLLDKDPAARPDAREAARLLAGLAAPPPPDPRLPSPAPEPAAGAGAGESLASVPDAVPGVAPDAAPEPVAGFGPPVVPPVAPPAVSPSGGDPAAVTRPASGRRAARRGDRGRKGSRANAVVAASVAAVLLAGGGITYALMDRDDSARASGARSGGTGEGADGASGAAGEPGHVLEPGGTGTAPASVSPGTAPSATGPDGSAAPSGGDAGGTAASGGASRDGTGGGAGDGGTDTGSGGSSGPAAATSGGGGTDTGSGTAGASGGQGGTATGGDDSTASSGATGGSGTSGGSTSSGGSGGGATAPAGATTAAPDPTTQAPAPAGCEAGGAGTVCQVVSAGVTRRHDGGEMGTIGTGPHTFYCQVDLDHSETSGGVSSRWFARTDDDSGNTNVYFSVLHLGGGGSGGPVDGLRIC
ncbi:serine/threonine-protein kinase [Streptomyces filamentosus]|nr:serine/threonine-protein kinase [Streptomyces filamentosus]